MAGRVVHFEVPFDDVERATGFYQDVFGWQIHSMPEFDYHGVSTGPTSDQGMPSEPGYIGLDTYDVLHQRVVSHHFRFDEGRRAELGRTPHRYIWPSELDLMAQLAGMSLRGRWGGWSGEPFTSDSRKHVSVWEKPA